MLNMHRLRLGNLRIPEIYVCKDDEAARTCRVSGIPYIKWAEEDETELVLSIMLPALSKAMPGIDWVKAVRGRGGKVREVHVFVPSPDGYAVEEDEEWNVAGLPDEVGENPCDAVGGDLPDEASDDVDGAVEGVMPDEVSNEMDGVLRRCGGAPGLVPTERIKASDFVRDTLSTVDAGVIAEMGLMPKFLGEIEENIRFNITESMRFRDSYNKKLGACVGNFDMGSPSSNLLIVDVSASIPWGVADTLLKMLDTMREQANADLIVHAAASYWFPKGDELPSPEKLRAMCPRGQEAEMFAKIIETEVCGRKFDNVISFGDYDAPWCDTERQIKLCIRDNPPTVGKLWCYHVYCRDRTGFTRWVDECSPDCEKEYKCGWADVMKG